MTTSWPHAPTHMLAVGGTFIVTAGSYRKLHHFRTAERLETLQRSLLRLGADAGWQIEAWAVFSNHYHFVAQSPETRTSADDLSRWLGALHAETSGWANRLDRTPGRRVWHNFWETRLTYRGAYLARLNYVHQNAVKHGLVPVAEHYPWCSAAWFERTASPSQVRTVYAVETDRVRVSDEFDPIID